MAKKTGPPTAHGGTFNGRSVTDGGTLIPRDAGLVFITACCNSALMML